MDDFRGHFDEQELAMLREIKPIIVKTKMQSPHPILAYDDKRKMEYFAFRDMGEYPSEWNVEKTGDEAVDNLMRKVRTGLYDYLCIQSLKWEPGHLYIMDNKRVFHARTEQTRKTQRHLKRIRVI